MNKREYIVKRRVSEAKAVTKDIKVDFLDSLPRNLSYALDELRSRFRDCEWFEKAWNEYRDHVLQGGRIKAPGFIFNKHIEKQIKEDVNSLTDEQINSMLEYPLVHSDLYLDEIDEYLEHFNENHDPKTGQFTSGDASNVRKVLNEGTKITGELSKISRDTPKGSVRVNNKDYSKLSDAEMQKTINRIDLERRYGDAVGDTKYIQSGKEKTRETLQTVGSVLAIGASAIGIIWSLKQLLGSRKNKGTTAKQHK